MDRVTYDPTIDPSTILDRSLREVGRPDRALARRDDGRLRYAVTPRFAVSCTAELLRESAALARATGAYWQTHVSEDRGEIAEVARLFPEAIDYVDVYDRAGGLGERTVLAHAVHLSDRELARLVETGTRVAHCPASNLFLASGRDAARALPRGRAAGRARVGRGRRARPVDLRRRCGSAFYAQNALRVAGAKACRPSSGRSTGSGWARSRAPGSSASTTSSARSRRARRPTSSRSTRRSSARSDGLADDDPTDLMSRLIFRAHPDMVRAAWVRGRALEGPGRSEHDDRASTRIPTLAQCPEAVALGDRECCAELRPR